MDFYDLIIRRHSVRKYTEQKVTEEQIKKIIVAGLTAPSGGNTQPWHFSVIQNQEEQSKLVRHCKQAFLQSHVGWRKKWATMDNFNPFYAPSVIIVVSNKNTVENSNEDCCFAIQNMVLMAESLGLGSCIIRDICWAIDKTNQSEFGIPQDYDCFMCLSVGYPVLKNDNVKELDFSKVNYLI